MSDGCQNHDRGQDPPQAGGEPKVRVQRGVRRQATPRTDAAAKRALLMLTTCKNAEDYKNAVKATISDLLALAKDLEIELADAGGLPDSIIEALNSGDGTYKP